MLKLEVKKRDVFGKKALELSDRGVFPAEMYGHGFSNEHVEVKENEFAKIFKEAGKSSVINLSLEGEIFPVLIYNVQKNSISDKIINVDFYRVRMDEKITTNVPIRFIGESLAIKEKNGVLVKSLESIEVEALPSDLPHAIEVSLESLVDIHSSVHVKDMQIPKGVDVLTDLETVIATVVEQAKEEVKEETVPETVTEGTEITEKEATNEETKQEKVK